MSNRFGQVSDWLGLSNRFVLARLVDLGRIELGRLGQSLSVEVVWPEGERRGLSEWIDMTRLDLSNGEGWVRLVDPNRLERVCRSE